MIFPNYTPGRKRSKEEILSEHPEIAEKVNMQNSWSQYERTPNRDEFTSEDWRLLPDDVKEGNGQTRIDAWIIPDK